MSTVAGTFNSTYCFASIPYNTTTYTNFTSLGLVWLNGTAFQMSYGYSMTSYTQGNYTFMTLFDDISAFSGAGFDYRARLLLSFILIFTIVALVSWKFNSLINPEPVIILQWALVFLFSYIGWMTIVIAGVDFPVIGTPGTAGYIAMAKYAIFILDTIATMGYLIWRHS